MTEQRAVAEPRRISPHELKTLLDIGAELQVLDCRSEASYQSSNMKIPGAIRVPPDNPRAAVSLAHDKFTVTYCT